MYLMKAGHITACCINDFARLIRPQLTKRTERNLVGKSCLCYFDGRGAKSPDIKLKGHRGKYRL
jgi:hypothetical protein